MEWPFKVYGKNFSIQAEVPKEHLKGNRVFDFLLDIDRMDEISGIQIGFGEIKISGQKRNYLLSLPGLRATLKNKVTMVRSGPFMLFIRGVNIQNKGRYVFKIYRRTPTPPNPDTIITDVDLLP